MKNVNDKVGFVLKIDERAKEGKAEKRLWEKSWVEKEEVQIAKRKRWYDHPNTQGNLAKQGGN